MVPPLAPDTAWLVPHLPSALSSGPSSTVRCWLMALSPGTFLVRAGQAHELRVTLAESVRYGGKRIYSAFVELAGLTPDTLYELSLSRVGAGAVLDRAQLRTWPAELGGADRPFRMMLGSCFSTQSLSRGGNQLGGLFRRLTKRDTVPHMKLLCGDQVYLDIPVTERVPDGEQAIRELLLDKYLHNWGAREGHSSQFGALLRTGANLLLSDDHEFWNNYPSPAVYAPRLSPALGGGQRAAWFAGAARDLLLQFQGLPPLFRHYRIPAGAGAVSVIAMDGRRWRTGQRAHPDVLLAELKAALTRAKGPVVLALSQPLFEPSARRRVSSWWRTHVSDLMLSDLTDYRALVQLLWDTGKDILLLSGDIHGGRVCSVRSPAQNIFEVVASPLSLVAPASRYCDELPSAEYPDLEGTHPKYSRIMAQQGPVTGNHAAQLCLSRRGDALQVTVEYVSCQSGATLKVPGSGSFTLRSLR